nr:MAG TPA: hypothetical protein [Caudoviricetes sp.]
MINIAFIKNTVLSLTSVYIIPYNTGIVNPFSKKNLKSC